jgi:hypothetical protein
MPLRSVRLAFSATERHAVQRKNPSVTSCHSPFVLRAVADRDGEACESRATLGVTELGIVVMFPTRATWFAAAAAVPLTDCPYLRP